MQKRTALIAIVLTEITIGSVILGYVYKTKVVDSNSVLGASKVIKFDSTTVVTGQDPELEYYWELAPNRLVSDKAEWLPEAVTYTYNSDGLNDRFNYEVEKSPNTFRIITLGDSFTAGVFVNTKDSWPEQLEEMLNNGKKCQISNFEVINLGVSGYDIRYIVKRFKKFGLKYDPDMVIWLESGSGLSRNLEEMDPKIKECVKAEETDKIANEMSAQQKHESCWGKVERLLIEHYTFLGFIDKVTSYLNEFFSKVDESKVYYISFHQTISFGDSEAVFEKWREKFPQAHIEARIPNLVDLELLPDGHPSAIGHYKIATEMVAMIQIEHPEFFNCK